MFKRLTERPQLTFRWEADGDAWNALPSPQQTQCQELLAQLLRAVAAGEARTERSAGDEREDS